MKYDNLPQEPIHHESYDLGYQKGRADGYSQAENDYFKKTEGDRANAYDCGYENGRVDQRKEDEELNYHYQTSHECYMQGRTEIIDELLSIKDPCYNCYMEFCESCRHNGEYSANIQAKLEQLKEHSSEKL